ncbi:MAG: CDP-diacylglycerol--glycerol-3-phosphate 3-phosphatidyltransferase [Clostridiales bacterium]|nr:CDP-diacylglycerol--glycerol-3-phosphate 3-phosphatidyltransferase [Clostridiales bacterium]
MAKLNIPTRLTIVRIILIPLFVALYLIDFPYNGVAAVAVFMIASFTDFLDGYLARKWNQVTSLGKFLDPIADKMLVMCALVALLLDQSQGPIFTMIVAIFLMLIESRELIVSCFRIIAASKGLVLAADRWGKMKTVCQMVALIVLLPHRSLYEIFGGADWLSICYYIGFALLAAATLLAIISGANYIIKNKKVLSDGN